MSTITDQQREAAFEQASDVQLRLYGSNESAQALAVVATKHDLGSISKQMDFLIAVGDVVLGLVPQAQLPQLLAERTGVNQATAMRLTGDILDFLEPLAQASSAPATQQAPAPQADTPTTAPTETVAASASDTLAAELAETEAAFHQLQPIRTMASDMQTLKHEEPTHQAASQADLLNGDGNGKKNPDAQWGAGQ